MKRNFLEGLGISDKELIDKILDENGKDIEAAKGNLEEVKTQLSTANEQLASANAQIDGFKAMDIDGVKRAADEWKEKFEKAQKDGEAALNKLRFDTALDKALSGAQAKNAKAVKALLDMEALKLDGEEIKGLNEQLEAVKSENAYLFDDSPSLAAGGSGSAMPKDFGFHFTGVRPKQ